MQWKRFWVILVAIVAFVVGSIVFLDDQQLQYLRIGGQALFVAAFCYEITSRRYRTVYRRLPVVDWVLIALALAGPMLTTLGLVAYLGGASFLDPFEKHPWSAFLDMWPLFSGVFFLRNSERFRAVRNQSTTP